MVRKENFPLFAGLISSLVIYINWNEPVLNIFSDWWVNFFVTHVPTAVLAIAGFAVGVRFLIRRNFKPVIILGIVLTAGAIGIYTYAVYLLLNLL